MRRLLTTAALTVVALTTISAADQWPQFRGPGAGVVPDDPGAARHLERDRERRLEDRHPGPRLELADRLGRSHLPDVGNQRRQGSRRRSRASTIRATTTATGGGRSALDGLRRRLQDRQGPLGARAAQGAPPLLRAHQEQLRVGNAGHRRRARLRLLRQHRPGRRARLQGQRRLDEERRRLQRRRRSSAPPRRRCSTRTGSIIVNDNTTESFIVAFDKKTGNELWRVNREERGNWSTPFVWENDLRTEIVTTGTMARSARTT